jgi:hypothetical protein
VGLGFASWAISFGKNWIDRHDGLIQHIFYQLVSYSIGKIGTDCISYKTCLKQCSEMLKSPEKEGKDLPEAPCAKSAVADRARSTRTTISVFIMIAVIIAGLIAVQVARTVGKSGKWMVYRFYFRLCANPSRRTTIA